MQKVTNITIEVALAKDGVKKKTKTKWYQHVYKFESSENWYSHFVKEKTPLYPVGTVVKEMEYEMDQYGGNIKSMVVGSIPAADAQHTHGTGQGEATHTVSSHEVTPQGIMGVPPAAYGKQHPVWMCMRWSTDLQLSRMDRIYPKHTEKEGETFPDLLELADEIVANGWFMFTQIKGLIGGKNPEEMKAAERQAVAGIGSPDLPPLEPEGDIPF